MGSGFGTTGPTLAKPLLRGDLIGMRWKDPRLSRFSPHSHCKARLRWADRRAAAFAETVLLMTPSHTSSTMRNGVVLDLGSFPGDIFLGFL